VQRVDSHQNSRVYVTALLIEIPQFAYLDFKLDTYPTLYRRHISSPTFLDRGS
jgi:hypothetical protein